MPAEPARCPSPAFGVELLEVSLNLPAQSFRQFIREGFSCLVDRLHPTHSWRLGGRIGELQKMLDNAADLAADRVALALAQIFDLLGHVLAVEPVVRDGHGSHHLRLVLRPGIEVVLVAWSLGLRSPSE